MKWISAAIIVAALLLSLGFYGRLPARMPIHWNAAGEIDGYASKAVGAFVMPGILLLLSLMFAALPKISPAGYGIDAASRGYRAIVVCSLLAMLVIHAVTLLVAIGVRVNMNAVMPLVLGALLAVTGNYLTTVPRNFFVGIRTPWTLASEDVWFRTHRFGGRLLMAGGVAVMLLPLLGRNALVPGLLAIVLGTAAVTIVYSYVIYRRDAHSSS